MKQEVWIDVHGYEEFYQVSNFGRFKIKEKIISKGKRGHRAFKEKIVLGTRNGKEGNDYMYVTLTKKGKEKQVRLHKLIAFHFCNNPENKPHVNHKDGNRFNNNCSNLEWTTVIENTCHSHKKKKYKSKYPGVTFIRKSGKWQSRITIKGKRISMGHFVKEIDAYNARLKFMKKNNISTKYSKI